MWFNKSSKIKAANKDAALQAKMLDSQRALLNAATETADAANDVTMLLRNKLYDTLHQIETTAKILPDALIVCDYDGNIETVNPSAEKIFQWSKADLARSNITTLFRGPKGESLIVDDFIIRATSCNETVYESSVMDCVRGKRRNGDTFWVELSISPLQRMNETAMVILCRDASKRIEMTMRLEENESKFRSIFEASMDGIVVVVDGVISTTNDAFAKMLDLSVENLIATTFSDYTSDEHKNVCALLEAQMTDSPDTNRVFVVKLVTGNDVLVSATNVNWGGVSSMLLTIKDLRFAS